MFQSLFHKIFAKSKKLITDSDSAADTSQHQQAAKAARRSRRRKSLFRRNSRRETEFELALNFATKHNLKDQLKTLLPRGARARFRNDQGDTCLHLAVESGHLDVVESVLPRSSVNEANDRFYTPLHLAVRNGDDDIVQLLLDAKADANARDSAGNTPLHDAVAQGARSLIYLLLDEGANPNVRNNDGNTAFHDSFRLLRDGNLTDHFLKCRANKHWRNSEGRSALHLAVMHSDRRVIRKLLETGASVDVPTDARETPLHVVLRHRRQTDEAQLLSVVRLLIDYGADVDKLDKDGHSPLDLAMSLRRFHTAKYMILSGARVPHGDARGATIAEALRDRDVEAMRCILSQICRCSFGGDNDRTPLFVAGLCITGVKLRQRIMRLLLDRGGADVNERYHDGSTLLHHSVTRKDLDLFKLLLGFGVDIHAKNQDGESPLFLAVLVDFYSCARILIDRGADVNDYVSGASLVEFKVPAGARCSLLSVAILQRNKVMIKLLLHSGADVNREYDGKLPLDYSITDKSSCSSVIQILVKHVALLAAQARCVHESNARLMESRPELLRRYDICGREIRAMRATRICEDYGSTYFDVLTERSEDALVDRLRCERVNEALKSRGYKKLFANYFDSIDYRYARALERLRKRSKLEEALKAIFGELFPGCVLGTISEFYNDRDFAVCIGEQI